MTAAGYEEPIQAATNHGSKTLSTGNSRLNGSFLAGHDSLYQPPQSLTRAKVYTPGFV